MNLTDAKDPQLQAEDVKSRSYVLHHLLER